MIDDDVLLTRVRDANPVAAAEPDWGLIERRLAGAADGGRRRGAGRRRAARLLACVAATAAVAGVLVLALAPGGGSSDSLARAAAALTPPAGSILYERWQETLIHEPGARAYRHGAAFGPEQLWMSEQPPHRYRTILQPGRAALGEVEAGAHERHFAFIYGVDASYVGPGFNPATGQDEALATLERGLGDGPLELGGALERASGQTTPGSGPPTLTAISGDRLYRARLDVTLGPTLPGPHDQAVEDGADPAQVLRAAIAEGRAHEAGTSRLDGREVLRIDIDVPRQLPADAPPLPADAPVLGHRAPYAYVEPGSFHPVEIAFGDATYRFLAYEYLPAIPANLALTDIAAQHPGAKIVGPLARVRDRAP